MNKQTVEEYLAKLSDDIERINLSNKDLTELPDLSRFTNLKMLDCCINSLFVLPENLPQSLQELYCYNNFLSKLPENLPQNLQILDCSYNYLLFLPDNLQKWPQNLQILYCYNNSLSYLLDNLPQSLQRLYCWNNPQLEIIYQEYNFKSCRFTQEKREYIYQVNMKQKIHEAIKRMAILNRNGALLEHAARLTGKPSWAIIDKV